ncbi:LysR substrate-binding domain-containing protein [Aeromicrobium alkaliterrae]|uniref:LysR family transcriptional regulator n=1 Tax=Aeromicrobium alkaliterrae TaxID=302168 RepID=A0ABP4VIR7_9ACTN
MELQQLRYVIAVAEESSFTRAAAQCFVVQSALSHQVKALERELGVTLFARTSRRVELTAAGTAFLPSAREALVAAERAGVDAAAAEGQVRGRLTIGVIPTVTALDVPAALGEFHRRHPSVRIGLRVAGSDELETAVAAGEVDVALLGLPRGREPRGVAWRHLADDRAVLAVARDHPLVGRRRVRLANLVDETFVDFPAGSPGRLQSDVAFAAAGLHRDVAFEVMLAGPMVDLVRHGLAVALLPSRFLDDAADDVVTIPVADGPTRSEHLAWSDFNPSPAAQAFLASLA